jgi:hypothetical protein
MAIFYFAINKLALQEKMLLNFEQLVLVLFNNEHQQKGQNSFKFFFVY